MTNTDKLYQERLSSITDELSANISKDYVANAGYITNLIQRIGRTVVNGTDAVNNPFSIFTAPQMSLGSVIQNVKLQFTKAQDYTPNVQTDPFTINKPKDVVEYITLNDSRQYQVTIHDNEFRRMFTSEQTLGDFVAAATASLYESMNLDQYTAWKQHITNHCAGLDLTSGTSFPNPVKRLQLTNGPGSEGFAMELIDTVRSVEQALRNPTTEFNLQGDLSVSNDTVIIMPRSNRLEIQKTLAGVFNMEQLGFDSSAILLVDDLGTIQEGNQTIQAVVTDRRALVYTPTLVEGSSIFNPRGLYYNTFLTVKGSFAISSIRNFACITSTVE